MSLISVAGASSQPMGPPKPKPTAITHVEMAQTQSKPTKPTVGPMKMECGGKDYAPHEKDCNKYYICQYGELVEQK